MAFPPSECHCSRQERGGDSAACASPSAPESLTRGHENTTSQVRVSGTERDTSPYGLLHLLPTWQLPLDCVFCQNGSSKMTILVLNRRGSMSCLLLRVNSGLGASEHLCLQLWIQHTLARSMHKLSMLIAIYHCPHVYL